MCGARHGLDLDELFASDLTPWWRAYLVTGILCGLRPGELLARVHAVVPLDQVVDAHRGGVGPRQRRQLGRPFVGGSGSQVTLDHRGQPVGSMYADLEALTLDRPAR